MEKTFKDWFAANLAEDAEDIVNHGVDAGFSGVIYTNECAELFDRFEDELYSMVSDDAEEFDYKSVPAYLATFGRADMAETFSGLKTLIVWYAVERMASELVNAA